MSHQPLLQAANRDRLSRLSYHFARAHLQALANAKQTIDAFAPGALVVALGLDASEHDPLKGMSITTNGFSQIGAALARIGLPTVIVQEGGYLSDVLGDNLTALLGGFEGAR